MSIPGKPELTIKMNELPDAPTVENGWKQFYLDCDGQSVHGYAQSYPEISAWLRAKLPGNQCMVTCKATRKSVHDYVQSYLKISAWLRASWEELRLEISPK